MKKDKSEILKLVIPVLEEKIEEAIKETSQAKENFERQKQNSLLSEKTISMKKEFLSKKEKSDYLKKLLEETNSWLLNIEKEEE